ncbi:hypothetical protein E5288_WYG006403 [Bos mutus]|uniref:Uncharacterized protein n=1 Tax=Bos mutus TaxID=72004 RepID=A0A6B0QR83_9CETA|nr:hypothetical protein [Bos mutus]
MSVFRDWGPWVLDQIGCCSSESRMCQGCSRQRSPKLMARRVSRVELAQRVPRRVTLSPDSETWIWLVQKLYQSEIVGLVVVYNGKVKTDQGTHAVTSNTSSQHLLWSLEHSRHSRTLF